MLDSTIIRENPDLVRTGMRRKGEDPAVVDTLLTLDTERRDLRQQNEQDQAKLNQASGKMATVSAQEREALRGELRSLSDGIKESNTRLAELDERYIVLMRQIPNLPHESVPDGGSDKENVVIRTEGVKREFSFQPKDHEELALALDLLDIERATKVSGTKFYYLKNELVILEQAVLRFALDILHAKGFTLMTVPHMARVDAFYGAAHFATPEDAVDGDAYRVERDDLYLTGTAEVGLVNYHANEIVREADLPLRYAGISPCYRREAGTYGKETRGLYRVHQFQKVEMVVLSRPADSWQEFDLLLAVTEEIMHQLELHYQVVLNCAGDLGHPQAKKMDIETWLPGMNKYGETHSCSHDTDYQARSLQIRYRKSGEEHQKEIEYVHTLNNTAIASPRILVAILENYQQEDGSIAIPTALIPYTGFTHITGQHDS